MESTDKPYLVEEWPSRVKVIVALLDVLKDGQSWKAVDLQAAIEKRHINVPKRIVNSVLFSEARRYVEYDRQSYTYQLRHADELDSSLQGITTSVGKVDAPKILLKVKSPPSLPTAEQVSVKLVGSNEAYRFVESELADVALFVPKKVGRVTELHLNQRHPWFQRFGGIFKWDHTVSEDANQAKRAMELLLTSWAKYESTLPEGKRLDKAQDVRSEWGRELRRLTQESQGHVQLVDQKKKAVVQSTAVDSSQVTQLTQQLKKLSDDNSSLEHELKKTQIILRARGESINQLEQKIKQLEERLER